MNFLKLIFDDIPCDPDVLMMDASLPQILKLSSWERSEYFVQICALWKGEDEWMVVLRGDEILYELIYVKDVI